jgi:membrane protein DedA with SNARE-associated domain
MIELETLAAGFVYNLPLFFILSMIATALWGDGALILFVTLSVHFKISLVLLFFSAFIGTFIGDSCWFFLGRKISRNLDKYKRINKGFETVSEVIDKIFKKKHFWALLTVKFLYGTRIITIFYLAKEKMTYKKFLFYDTFSTIFWIFGMGFIGYLIGLGFSWILRVFKSVQLAITLLLFCFALIYIIQKFINFELFKDKKKIEKIVENIPNP